MIEESFHRTVRRLTSKYTSLWFDASGNLPLFSRHFSRKEQRAREKHIDALRLRVPSGRKRIIAFIAQEIPGRRGARLRRFLEECGETGEKFVARARRFDPSISDAEVQQALRNLWVFNSLQFYLGKPVRLTPSSFAYSLLYPYTDNCLDSTRETSREKQELMRWLSLTLTGHPESADTAHKASIAALLDMIRKEHSRSRRPDVHQSLLGIHRAQKKAIRLCGSGGGKGEHALMPLTIEKGGASVLVDGFLAGRLNSAQTEAIFGYGVLLQLVDDLQDLEEDIDGSRSSPFSRAIRHGTLEGITNRLFNLTGMLARQLRIPGSTGSGHIATLVERSCMLLIQHAIAQHSHLYRRAYVSLLNRYVPVRMAYLRTLKSQ